MTPIVFLLVGCVTEEVQLDLQDVQNYSLQSDIVAENLITPSGVDMPVEWSGLTTDLQGREMDPTTEIDELRIIRFGSLTQEEIMEGIATDSLKQADITGFVNYSPEGGETSCMLTDFAFFNTPVDPAEHVAEGMGTYLFTALTGTYDYRMFTFFEPLESVDEGGLSLNSASAVLTLTVDLGVSEFIPLEKTHHYIIDWSGLTLDGYGHDLETSNIDQLMLARYTQSMEELEQDFVYLDGLGEETYQADVEERGEFDLMEATTTDGQAFEGFDGEGTWILALFCSTCVNPAPLFLGIFG